MRHLLDYLAQRTVRSPEQAPKEHEIAVDLLGRSTDFDPKLDPVVRVQTSRLRSKLAEYYVAEGASDHIFLQVPKGSYFLHASYRAPGAPVAETPEAERGRLRHRWAYAAIAVLLLAAAGVALWKVRLPSGDSRLRQFWQPYLDSPADSLLVYSNPRFVGSSGTALRLFDPARDQSEVISPGYTGVGEVVGAAEATKLFLSFGRSLRLKRSQLFSWDDAKAYNVIFLGAPPHNVSLVQIPLGRKLKIKPYAEEPRKNQGCIRNLTPQAGEDEFYCTYAEGPTTVEYSLVTMSPGVEGARAILVVAGTTTFGTQAAMEFLCGAERIAALNRSLKTKPGEAPPPFDALLRCRVRAGVPIGAELVLVRK